MSVVVGMVLIVLAGAELVSGIVDFFSDVKKTSIEPAGHQSARPVLLAPLPPREPRAPAP